MHAPRDAPESVGTVIHRIHARYHGEQNLRGADVAGRLFAPDMLLARLQCKSIGSRARRIDAHTDQPARQ